MSITMDVVLPLYTTTVSAYMRLTFLKELILLES